MAAERELAARLFDFTFTRFVTPKVVGILFGLAITMSAVLVLCMIVIGFTHGAGWGLLALIVSPIVFFCGVLKSRIVLETVMLIFWIADELKEIGSAKKAEEVEP